MADKTLIEWASATWNPIVGCEPVSPGCKNCYAARMASRFSGHGQQWENLAHDGKWTGLTKRQIRQYKKPLVWRRPRSIFVCSMGDLFYHGVPDELRLRLFFTMQQATHHRFLVLTKRHLEARDWLYKTIKKYAPDFKAHVMDHIWFGVTVEDQERCDQRVPVLQSMPVRRRFVSCEPLLAPVDLNPYLDTPAPMIDWIIGGGESGAGARAPHPDWAFKLLDTARVFGIPFLWKQWGEYSPVDSGERTNPCAVARDTGTRLTTALPLTDQLSSDHWCTMYRVGKAKAGRELDGVVYNEFPEGMPR